MDEITLELPPKNLTTVPIDEDTLRTLLLGALVSMTAYLSGCEPDAKLWVVYRPTAGGAEAVYLPIPNVYSAAVWDAFDEAWKAGTSTDLTNYLWDCGVPRLTLTGTAPDKDAWARAVSYQWLAPPLRLVLEDAVFRTMASGGQLSALPALSSDALGDLAGHIARSVSQGVNKVVAYVFNGSMHTTDFVLTDIPLADGVTLRPFDKSRSCLFRTTFEKEMHWEDTIGAMLFDRVLEITFDVAKGTPVNQVLSQVVKRLDAVRLSLTLLQAELWKVGEGLVLVTVDELPVGRSVVRLRRDSTNSWPSAELSQERIVILRSSLNSVTQAMQQRADISAAVWRFGRACTADLLQDKLAEAVMGLEALLVAGAGETTFRFSLHGTALLCAADEDPVALAKSLRKLYRLRSGAVHGDNREADYAGQSDLAIRYLARAIQAAITLCQQAAHDGEVRTATLLEKITITRAAGRQSP